MAQELTERQRRVLSYIEKYIAKHQVSPSMRDIAQALGFGSTNAVTQFLAILERKGHITRHQPEGVGQAAARSIRLVRQTPSAADLLRQLEAYCVPGRGVEIDSAVGGFVVSLTEHFGATTVRTEFGPSIEEALRAALSGKESQ